MITILGAGDITELAGRFGIWWPFLLAQLVNFALVIFVLYKFAFGPIQAILEQRKNRIAEGEEKLKRIEKDLAETEETTTAAIEKANADAQRLIDEAKESATTIVEQKTKEADVEARNIIAKAKESAKSEQERVLAELKAEFGKLVTDATANVTGKVLNKDDKARINKESLAAIQS